jgi:hypothetical protein
MRLADQRVTGGTDRMSFYALEFVVLKRCHGRRTRGVLTVCGEDLVELGYLLERIQTLVFTSLRLLHERLVHCKSYVQIVIGSEDAPFPMIWTALRTYYGLM